MGASKQPTTDEHRSTQMWGSNVKPRPLVASERKQTTNRKMKTSDRIQDDDNRPRTAQPTSARNKTRATRRAKLVATLVNKLVGKLTKFLTAIGAPPAITPPRSLPPHRMFVIWTSPH